MRSSLSRSEKPPASSEAVHRFMSNLKTRATGPEMALRREVHRRGMRFRVNVDALPGHPDLVLTRARVAVFMDGCFWHGCPKHGVAPKANAEWWRAKLDANVARDRCTDDRLRELGWTVLRAWEHEDPSSVADVVEALWRRQVGARKG